MDPLRTWAQDVLRCHLCEIPVPSLYCDICKKHVCKACVGEHFSDESTAHKVVPLKIWGATTICQKHSSNICELQCVQCDIPICLRCISCGEHEQHKKVNILESFMRKKAILQKDLQELEEYINPKYREIASNISEQKADLNKNSQELASAINKHGEDLHKEIDAMIQKLKSDLTDMDSKHLTVLSKQEDEIKHTISEITASIADLKKILESNEVGLPFAYKSRNAEFRRLPPKLTVTLPCFTPHEINRKNVSQQFGFLSASSIQTAKHSYTLKSAEAKSFPPDRLFIDVPLIITDITAYNEWSLCNVFCPSDEEIWTSGYDKFIRLYNLRGELVDSVQSKSGISPGDITVTRSGHLVYTDQKYKTVEIVNSKITEIKTLIRIQGWKPHRVCSTLSDDLLVIMNSGDYKQVKVVRYSGSTEKQCIQFNDKGRPLFSSGRFIKYICENRNLDICVSDSKANAIVVVNQAGKLRFTYTGPPSTIKGSFLPKGITTDSQSRILAVDWDKSRIHIIDQDGQFLRYIDNCHLQSPLGICLDTRDNLFVAENKTGKVKKIQYYQ
ncbi:tripartite motif-containing protein 2-like [Magallana gigas]|uniref:tripartite motif-containing protein 2-like n=1 Tax=Magallana gigas TaxID=29159 RepID=UPI003342B7DB